MPRSEKILIVEDELLIAEHIADLLGELGFHQLRMVDSVEEAIVEIEKDRPDLVFTDISLSTEMTGIDLGEKLIPDSIYIYYLSFRNRNGKNGGPDSAKCLSRKTIQGSGSYCCCRIGGTSHSLQKRD